GDRKKNLINAINLLIKNGIKINKISSIYLTQPVDFLEQDWFYNLVLEAESDLQPLDLLNLIKKIEKEMGRRKVIEKGPRNIDIDIILAEEKIIKANELKIPHPRMHLRNFVLAPLNEICPNIVHPEFKKNIKTLFTQSKDNSVVKKLDDNLEGVFNMKY
ncbi:2-amino-4-hydroxy-6-hydroxymethyldihydropteridine diphosphokinase, partial [Candidatus Aminicenantes bacterium AC-335-B20]|nr:2-amino-4-hydroxy-6-hydroxymethyldihydropteridine diphosphokinase [Candidatus Aminicenantes bacterium AC-335-B20]